MPSPDDIAIKEIGIGLAAVGAIVGASVAKKKNKATGALIGAAISVGIPWLLLRSSSKQLLDYTTPSQETFNV